MKTMNKLYLFKILIILFVLSFIFNISCSKDSTIAPIKMFYNYFPVDTGYWIQYQVDSTVWDDFTGQQLHYQFQVLEVFESLFTDNEGNEAIRIERYRKMDDTTNWTISDVWFGNIQTHSAQKVEENIRYVKLIFPVKEETKWDGNIYNHYQPEQYKYKSTHTPMLINSFQFDSTLTVVQKYRTNLLEEINKYEIYAYGVGMVEKYHKEITKNIVTGEIVKGIEYSYKIINHKLK